MNERIEAGKLEMPILPDIAVKILNNALDQNIDIHTLSELIHRDQTLAGHVLRVSNSAAYAAATNIISLQQALIRLGMVQLREIVVAVAFKSRIFHVPGQEALMKRLWRSSAGAAAYAKEIAQLRRQDVEKAFLCGLLHDVAKPVLLLALVDIQRELHQKFDLGEVLASLEDFPMRVGSIIAEELAVPPQIRETMLYYSKYNEAPTFREDAMQICLADRLSQFVFSSDKPDESTFLNHPVFEDMKLTDEETGALLAKRDEVIKFVDSFT